MAIIQHRRATAASMFKNSISRNTKCDNLVGFPKSSHIYIDSTALKSLNFELDKLDAFSAAQVAT